MFHDYQKLNEILIYLNIIKIHLIIEFLPPTIRFNRFDTIFYFDDHE